MNLPEEIENTFLELAAFDERIKARRARVRSLELQITLDVTTAKDPETGKLLLTNEKQREAAIANQLADSVEYDELATELGNLEQDRLRLQARLERLRMEFRVEMLEAEQRNALAVLKVADALYAARTSSGYPLPRREPEIELPF
jgi:molecular chaperone GrpE (heat shock protein)